MIRVRLVDNYYSQRDVIHYSTDYFYRALGGSIGDNPKKPPFRDEASMLFIREIDKGELVEGDWYSYVSPYGRTCMSSLCGGTKYALTAIYYSKRGCYMSYKGYEDDIWSRLMSIEQDVLIALTPSVQWYHIPYEFEGCIVENISIGGTVYKEAVYDCERSEFYVDNNGIAHFDGSLHDYEWKWEEHLKDIFDDFRRDFESDEKYYYIGDRVSPEEAYIEDFFRNNNFKLFRGINDTFPKRLIRNYVTECKLEGLDKYPRGFYIGKKSDGTYEVSERCPYKYPTFNEAIQIMTDWWWNDEYEEAFCVFIDIGIFEKSEDIKEERLWYFHDDGEVLEIYSGRLGMKKLLDFVGNAVEEGRICAVEDK